MKKRLSVNYIICLGMLVFLLFCFFKNNKLDTKYNIYKIKFDLNGADSITKNNINCIDTGNGYCKVKLPLATRKNGVVLGFSEDKNSKMPFYFMDMEIQINRELTLYVISYQVNILKIEDNNLDYIENKEIKCFAYNKNDSCQVTLPIYNKEGYEIKGYSTDSSSSIGEIYPKESFKITQNMIIYPIYDISNRLEVINVRKSLIFNGIILEIENDCKDELANRFLMYLEDIRKNAPYLLVNNKITFLGEKSYEKIWGNDSIAMNYGPQKYRSFDIICSNKLNDYYASIIHELAHSWDFFSYSKMGSNITSNNDVIELFNKYTQQENRPFRNYSYSNIYEFFADALKFYYFKYVKPTYEYYNLNYPEDIKNIIEKYICFANNNYELEKCKNS